jgi:hypothetical protein
MTLPTERTTALSGLHIPAVWKTALLATPALVFLLVRLLPIYSGSATRLEQQLRSTHWLALFLSPAFLPWVIRAAWSSWKQARTGTRGVLLLLVLAATLATAEATRWAIAMAYPPPGDTVTLPESAE